jgi:hypothetical protein
LDIRSAILGVSTLAVILASCSEKITQTSLPASEAPIESSVLPSDALFLDAESPAPAPSASHIARSRVVKINFSVLLDESGHARMGDTVTLNLFPDVTYTGIIDQIEENDESYTWVGHLKDVEYSSLTLIFTGGIFIAKIASPGGIYEVSNAGGDLYRVVLIDQEKFPGGEDVVAATPTDP